MTMMWQTPSEVNTHQLSPHQPSARTPPPLCKELLRDFHMLKCTQISTIYKHICYQIEGVSRGLFNPQLAYQQQQQQSKPKGGQVPGIRSACPLSYASLSSSRLA